jgi:Nitrile hydratase, alpha chain
MADEQAREAQEKWSNLVKEAVRDQSLRRRLIENPARVLEEHGLEVRPGLEVRVVENTDKVAYLTLPVRPPEGELSADQLDRVAGGGRASTAPTISEIVVTKRTDASSTNLF